MKIDEALKVNLLADVENILEIDLTEEQREALARCFEVTISCNQFGAIGRSHIAILGIDAIVIDDITKNDLIGVIDQQTPLLNTVKAMAEMALPELIPSVRNYKTGQENRRERRKIERYNKSIFEK